MFSPEMLDAVERVSLALEAHGFVMACAESCTGGLIGAAMTERAGSSRLFDRGFITYSNQAKMDLLGVPAGALTTFGAVSAPVAEAMATGAISHSLADVSVSVTGIAGPGGGAEDKPVGLVYIGIAVRGGAVQAHRHLFSGDRSAIREQAARAALLHLLTLIDTQPCLA